MRGPEPSTLRIAIARVRRFDCVQNFRELLLLVEDATDQNESVDAAVGSEAEHSSHRRISSGQQRTTSS
jgi:hypothetical protein